jgi:hypothetical protein
VRSPKTVETAIETGPLADAEQHDKLPVHDVEQAIPVAIEVSYPCFRLSGSSELLYAEPEAGRERPLAQGA